MKIKKYILFFIVLLTSIYNVKSQVRKIHNDFSEKYVNIPGTKHSMIKLDSSFTTSSNFTGFENVKLEAGININLVPMPFDQLLQMFSKDFSRTFKLK